MLALLTALLVAAPPAYESQIVSIDVQDAQVTDVLRLLTERVPVNLVVSDAVKGRITVKLRDVKWKDALQVVLSARGLGVMRSGSVYEVDTLERLNARAAQAVERRDLALEAGTPVTRIIPVRYARAADLAPIVKGVLSPRGRVLVDERTNTLVVTDVAPRADAAEALIRGR